MNSTPWLIYPKPNPQTKLRLFCCHPAGSGASIFRSWVNYLHPEIELCALQLPGRETRIREPLYTQLSPLIDTLNEVLSPHLETCPFAFFGHSLGALICFALARKLRYQQLPEPIHLFISGRRPPHIPIEEPIHQEVGQILIDKLREFGGTSEAVLQNTELMSLFVPIFRADLTINETYFYTIEPPLNSPITAFGGIEDSSVNQEELSLWNQHTSNSFQLEMFPGNHMFFLEQTQPLIDKISHDLCDYL